jgi:hypothetical protein
MPSSPDIFRRFRPRSALEKRVLSFRPLSRSILAPSSQRGHETRLVLGKPGGIHSFNKLFLGSQI